MLFKKILNLDYVYPDGFSADAKDLVQKLLVLDPNERLGAKDARRYTSIRSHPFYKGLDFDTLHTTYPPPIYPYLPGNSEGQELRSHYRVPDHLEPGLDDKQLTRLLGLDGQSGSATTTPATTIISANATAATAAAAAAAANAATTNNNNTTTTTATTTNTTTATVTTATPSPATAPRPRKRSGILQMNDEEKQHQLHQQRCTSNWHSLVEGNLIVKQGLVDKRKVSVITTNPTCPSADAGWRWFVA